MSAFTTAASREIGPHLPTRRNRSATLLGLLGHDDVNPGQLLELEHRILDHVDRIIDEGEFRFEKGFHGVCNLIVVDDETGKVYASGDSSALFPLYYIRAEGGLIVSSHLQLLAKSLGVSPDPVGVAERLTLLYTVGPRTEYEGISRLEPGEHLIYDVESDELTIVDKPEYYVGPTRSAPVDELAKLVWEAFVRACARASRGRDPIGLMLSGGLDSRLVAAGLKATGARGIACTHGQPGYHEVKSASRVAALAGMPHHLVDLSTDSSIGSTESFEGLFWRADGPVFPEWRHGARVLAGQGAKAAASGFMLDASLGGHFHDSARPRDRLVRRIRGSLLGPSERFRQEIYDENYEDSFCQRLAAKVERGLRYRRPLVVADRIEELESSLPAVRHDIANVMARLRKTGTESPGKRVERFLTEQHARKFSFSQELVLRSVLPIVVPSYDRELISLLSSIEAHVLADHYLYYEVLRKHVRSFAKVPGSANALPMTWPTPVLELGRLGRNRWDNRARARFLATEGRTRLRPFGPSNFEEVARSCGNLDTLESLLAADSPNSFVEAERARKWISEIRSYERKSFNMLELTSLASVQLTYMRE